MMPPRTILQIKKRIIKSAMRIPPYLDFFDGGSGESRSLFRDSLLIFDVGGQHGCDIPVIIAFQKRITSLVNILVFSYQRGIDKHTALFFISESPFCHKPLDESLYRLWTPACRFG